MRPLGNFDIIEELLKFESESGKKYIKRVKRINIWKKGIFNKGKT